MVTVVLIGALVGMKELTTTGIEMMLRINDIAVLAFVTAISALPSLFISPITIPCGLAPVG